MASYVVPQVEIHQLFSEIPVSLTQNQVPFIFGPNYILHRYEDANEKAGTYVGEYTFTGDAESSDPLPFYQYPNALNPKAVDHSYTKLYADNAMVALAHISPEHVSFPITYEDETQGDGNKLGIELPEALANEVTVGRKLRIYPYTGRSTRADDGGDSSKTFPTPKYIDVTILGVKELKRIPYSEESFSSVNPVAGGTTNTTSTESSPNSTRSLKSMLRNVYEDVAEGDLLYLEVTIDETLDLDLQLEEILLCEIQNGVEISKKVLEDPSKTAFFWNDVEVTDETDSDDLGIEIQTPLVVKIADRDFNVDMEAPGLIGDGVPQGYGPIISADLYVTFRELSTAASDTIHSIRSVSDVVDALGAVSPDNPLAQAVYNAALNAGGQTVRYMAVPTDDDYGYDKVLAAATLTKEVYFMVPVTRKQSVLDKVQAHVGAMSAPTTKRWRIAFVSAEVPNNDTIYNAGTTTDGRDLLSMPISINTEKKTADIAFVVSSGEGYDLNPDTRFKRDLKVGDILVTAFDEKAWGEPAPLEFKIVEILSNNRVRVSDPKGLVNAPEIGAEPVPAKTEIYHPLTNAEKAEYIRNLSSNFSDRRIYNIFPSQFYGSGVLQTGEFAAAAVAGLVSSCLPQQPVTNLELVGIDDIPMVYQTFSYDELNTIASGGTFIVMQDLPGDQVYIRHQISTDYEANNLNTAELSITKNLDSISYFFDDLCSPYIGKYNITPELLLVLRNVITAGLTSLESTSWGLYGPQIIAEGTEILLLEQDALLKDHVNCNIKLNLPYPFNHLVLKLFV